MTTKSTFIELIEQHMGLINKVTFLYADNPEDREDLQQEVITQAWSSYASFRGDAKFSTWLYRVALNTAISGFKRNRRHTETREQLMGEVVQYANDRDLLEMILAILNPIEKSIVLLQIEGYAQAEIAEMLGISDGNTRTKIHRIRKKLEHYGIKDLTAK